MGEEERGRASYVLFMFPHYAVHRVTEGLCGNCLRGFGETKEFGFGGGRTRSGAREHAVGFCRPHRVPLF